MKPLYDQSITEISELIKGKKVSSVELTKAVLKRINSVEPKVKAFITLTPELALKQARAADKKIHKKKEISVIAGIPLSVKDVFATKGIKTTTGSKILYNYIPPYDATVIKRIKNADGVIVGKTNQDEFARGFTTETSFFKITANPWDLSRTPGGSSGGSAASVAAGESIYSLCSEHYDSIRQPAAWCGVVGFKPTYGRVSRYGIVAMASSLECPGTICKSVKDAAIVLEIIAGYDPLDSNSVKKAVPPYSKNLSFDIRKIVLGVPKEYLGKGIESGIKINILNAIKIFQKLGAKVKEVTLLPAEYSTAVYEILYASEVASNLARYDGIRYGFSVKKPKNLKEQYFTSRKVFGPLIKTQIITDLRSLSGGGFEKIYHQALKVRRLVKSDFDGVFKGVNLIVGPMSPCIAYKKGFYSGGKYQPTEKTDQFRPLVNLYSHPPTLVGLPGISVPCGFSQSLPVGLQIYGPKYSEQLILNAAYAYENETQWYKIKPTLK